jgi:ATP-dependent Lhr-like helicase
MCGKDAQLDAALMPLNTLDVLSQWLVLQSLVEPLSAQEAFDTAKLCGMFESLTRYAFDSVVEALTIEDEDLAKYHVYPKLKFEEQKLVPARKGVVLLFRQNVGTILQQGTVRVRVQEAIVGYLDEEFAQLLKPGDVFVLAGQTYVCTRLQGMTLFAQETHVRKPTIPRWRSTSLYTSALVAKKAQQLKTGLDALYCEPELAKQIAMYVKLQKLALSKGELVEYYKDNGVVYTIVHAGCGRAITECLASVFVYAAQKKYNTVFQSSATDTGFFIAGSQGVAIDKLTSDVLPGFTQILDHALTESEQVKRRFRSVATRSLLLIQNYMSVRKSIGRQQMTGQLLYYALRAHPGHMLPKAALQEAKENLDVPGAIEYLPKLVDAKHTDYTHLPSLFAAGIVASALDMLTPKDKQRFFVTLLAMHSMPKKEQVFTYAQAWDEMQVVTQSMYETYLGVKPRLRLDPQIQFELERMLTGSIDGFSATYLAWLDGLLSGTIPKIWPDAVILALKEARIQVRSV